LPYVTARHLDVREHRVDLPRFAVGGVHPHLVLHRVATRHLVLGRSRETLVRETLLRRRDLVRRLDLDAQVVESSALAVAGDQDELERRLRDGEVGIAGSDLRRSRAEELGVEGDRVIEVGDVERQLDSTHGSSTISGVHWRLSMYRSSRIYPRMSIRLREVS
jgi:hypothetical protein